MPVRRGTWRHIAAHIRPLPKSDFTSFCSSPHSSPPHRPFPLRSRHATPCRHGQTECGPQRESLVSHRTRLTQRTYSCPILQLGRAPCRETLDPYVSFRVVLVYITKKT